MSCLRPPASCLRSPASRLCLLLLPLPPRLLPPAPCPLPPALPSAPCLLPPALPPASRPLPPASAPASLPTPQRAFVRMLHLLCETSTPPMRYAPHTQLCRWICNDAQLSASCSDRRARCGDPRAVRAALRREYRVVECAEAPAALALVQNDAFGAIVLEPSYGDERGWQALAARASIQAAQCRWCCAACWTSGGAAWRWRGTYLVKPVLPARLLETLRAVMEQKMPQTSSASAPTLPARWAARARAERPAHHFYVDGGVVKAVDGVTRRWAASNPRAGGRKRLRQKHHRHVDHAPAEIAARQDRGRADPAAPGRRQNRRHRQAAPEWRADAGHPRRRDRWSFRNP